MPLAPSPSCVSWYFATIWGPAGFPRQLGYPWDAPGIGTRDPRCGIVTNLQWFGMYHQEWVGFNQPSKWLGKKTIGNDDVLQISGHSSKVSGLLRGATGNVWQSFLDHSEICRAGSPGINQADQPGVQGCSNQCECSELLLSVGCNSLPLKIKTWWSQETIHWVTLGAFCVR